MLQRTVFETTAIKGTSFETRRVRSSNSLSTFIFNIFPSLLVLVDLLFIRT